MSYIQEKERIFEEDYVKIPRLRSEARMKKYSSSEDVRAWCDEVEDRRQHFIKYLARNKGSICEEGLLPIDIFPGSYDPDLQLLRDKIKYLEALLDIYRQLKLKGNQKQKLSELQKQLDEEKKKENAEVDKRKQQQGEGRKRRASGDKGRADGKAKKKRDRSEPDLSRKETEKRRRKLSDGEADGLPTRKRTRSYPGTGKTYPKEGSRDTEYEKGAPKPADAFDAKRPGETKTSDSKEPMKTTRDTKGAREPADVETAKRRGRADNSGTRKPGGIGSEEAGDKKGARKPVDPTKPDETGTKKQDDIGAKKTGDKETGGKPVGAGSTKKPTEAGIRKPDVIAPREIGDKDAGGKPASALVAGGLGKDTDGKPVGAARTKKPSEAGARKPDAIGARRIGDKDAGGRSASPVGDKVTGGQPVGAGSTKKSTEAGIRKPDVIAPREIGDKDADGKPASALVAGGLGKDTDGKPVGADSTKKPSEVETRRPDASGPREIGDKYARGKPVTTVDVGGLGKADTAGTEKLKRPDIGSKETKDARARKPKSADGTKKAAETDASDTKSPEKADATDSKGTVDKDGVGQRAGTVGAKKADDSGTKKSDATGSKDTTFGKGIREPVERAGSTTEPSESDVKKAEVISTKKTGDKDAVGKQAAAGGTKRPDGADSKKLGKADITDTKKTDDTIAAGKPKSAGALKKPSEADAKKPGKTDIIDTKHTEDKNGVGKRAGADVTGGPGVADAKKPKKADDIVTKGTEYKGAAKIPADAVEERVSRKPVSPDRAGSDTGAKKQEKTDDIGTKRPGRTDELSGKKPSEAEARKQKMVGEPEGDSDYTTATARTPKSKTGNKTDSPERQEEKPEKGDVRKKPVEEIDTESRRGVKTGGASFGKSSALKGQSSGENDRVKSPKTGDRTKKITESSKKPETGKQEAMPYRSKETETGQGKEDDKTSFTKKDMDAAKRPRDGKSVEPKTIGDEKGLEPLAEKRDGKSAVTAKEGKESDGADLKIKSQDYKDGEGKTTPPKKKEISDSKPMIGTSGKDGDKKDTASKSGRPTERENEKDEKTKADQTPKSLKADEGKRAVKDGGEKAPQTVGVEKDEEGIRTPEKRKEIPASKSLIGASGKDGDKVGTASKSDKPAKQENEKDMKVKADQIPKSFKDDEGKRASQKVVADGDEKGRAKTDDKTAKSSDGKKDLSKTAYPTERENGDERMQAGSGKSGIARSEFQKEDLKKQKDEKKDEKAREPGQEMQAKSGVRTGKVEPRKQRGEDKEEKAARTKEGDGSKSHEITSEGAIATAVSLDDKLEKQEKDDKTKREIEQEGISPAEKGKIKDMSKLGKKVDHLIDKSKDKIEHLKSEPGESRKDALVDKKASDKGFKPGVVRGRGRVIAKEKEEEESKKDPKIDKYSLEESAEKSDAKLKGIRGRGRISQENMGRDAKLVPGERSAERDGEKMSDADMKQKKADEKMKSAGAKEAKVGEGIDKPDQSTIKRGLKELGSRDGSAGAKEAKIEGEIDKADKGTIKKGVQKVGSRDGSAGVKEVKAEGEVDKPDKSIVQRGVKEVGSRYGSRAQSAENADDERERGKVDKGKRSRTRIGDKLDQYGQKVKDIADDIKDDLKSRKPRINKGGEERIDDGFKADKLPTSEGEDKDRRKLEGAARELSRAETSKGKLEAQDAGRKQEYVEKKGVVKIPRELRHELEGPCEDPELFLAKHKVESERGTVSGSDTQPKGKGEEKLMDIDGKDKVPKTPERPEEERDDKTEKRSDLTAKEASEDLIKGKKARSLDLPKEKQVGAAEKDKALAHQLAEAASTDDRMVSDKKLSEKDRPKKTAKEASEDLIKGKKARSLDVPKEKQVGAAEKDKALAHQLAEAASTDDRMVSDKKLSEKDRRKKTAKEASEDLIKEKTARSLDVPKEKQVGAAEKDEALAHQLGEAVSADDRMVSDKKLSEKDRPKKTAKEASEDLIKGKTARSLDVPKEKQVGAAEKDKALAHQLGEAASADDRMVSDDKKLSEKDRPKKKEALKDPLERDKHVQAPLKVKRSADDTKDKEKDVEEEKEIGKLQDRIKKLPGEKPEDISKKSPDLTSKDALKEYKEKDLLKGDDASAHKLEDKYKDKGDKEGTHREKQLLAESKDQKKELSKVEDDKKQQLPAEIDKEKRRSEEEEKDIDEGLAEALGAEQSKSGKPTSKVAFDDEVRERFATLESGEISDIEKLQEKIGKGKVDEDQWTKDKISGLKPDRKGGFVGEKEKGLVPSKRKKKRVGSPDEIDDLDVVGRSMSDRGEEFEQDIPTIFHPADESELSLVETPMPEILEMPIPFEDTFLEREISDIDVFEESFDIVPRPVLDESLTQLVFQRPDFSELSDRDISVSRLADADAFQKKMEPFEPDIEVPGEKEEKRETMEIKPDTRVPRDRDRDISVSHPADADAFQKKIELMEPGIEVPGEKEEKRETMEVTVPKDREGVSVLHPAEAGLFEEGPKLVSEKPLGIKDSERKERVGASCKAVCNVPSKGDIKASEPGKKPTRWQRFKTKAKAKSKSMKDDLKAMSSKRRKKKAGKMEQDLVSASEGEDFVDEEEEESEEVSVTELAEGVAGISRQREREDAVKIPPKGCKASCNIHQRMTDEREDEFLSAEEELYIPELHANLPNEEDSQFPRPASAREDTDFKTASSDPDEHFFIRKPAETIAKAIEADRKSRKQCMAICRSAKMRQSPFGEETGGIILLNDQSPQMGPPGYYQEDLTPREHLPEWASLPAASFPQHETLSISDDESIEKKKSSDSELGQVEPGDRDEPITEVLFEAKTKDAIPTTVKGSVVSRVLSGQPVGIGISPGHTRQRPASLSEAILQQKSNAPCRAPCSFKPIEGFSTEEEISDTVEDRSQALGADTSPVRTQHQAATILQQKSKSSCKAPCGLKPIEGSSTDEELLATVEDVSDIHTETEEIAFDSILTRPKDEGKASALQAMSVVDNENEFTTSVDVESYEDSEKIFSAHEVSYHSAAVLDSIAEETQPELEQESEFQRKARKSSIDTELTVSPGSQASTMVSALGPPSPTASSSSAESVPQIAIAEELPIELDSMENSELFKDLSKDEAGEISSTIKPPSPLLDVITEAPNEEFFDAVDEPSPRQSSLEEMSVKYREEHTSEPHLSKSGNSILESASDVTFKLDVEEKYYSEESGSFSPPKSVEDSVISTSLDVEPTQITHISGEIGTAMREETLAQGSEVVSTEEQFYETETLPIITVDKSVAASKSSPEMLDQGVLTSKPPISDEGVLAHPQVRAEQTATAAPRPASIQTETEAPIKDQKDDRYYSWFKGVVMPQIPEFPKKLPCGASCSKQPHKKTDTRLDSGVSKDTSARPERSTRGTCPQICPRRDANDAAVEVHILKETAQQRVSCNCDKAKGKSHSAPSSPREGILFCSRATQNKALPSEKSPDDLRNHQIDQQHYTRMPCRARCATFRSMDKDKQIEELLKMLETKEDYCAEQRKIASNALQQLDTIKSIVEERDELQKKLKTSHAELEELKKNFVHSCAYGDLRSQCSKASEDYVPCESGPGKATQDIQIFRLEQEIKLMKSSHSITPDQETQIMKKELEVLKKYCGKLSTIQNENTVLKKKNKDLEDRMAEFEQFKSVEELKQQLKDLEKTTSERDKLYDKVQSLERELFAYESLPNNIDELMKRSMLLDDVIKDRDRLAKRVEQMRGIDEEVITLRLKAERVNELERQLRFASKDLYQTEDELDTLRHKCACAEIEAINHKTETDNLRSKIICMEHEMESLKSISKDQEVLQIEKERLQNSLDELVRMQDDYDQICVQLKAMEVIKAEKDMYKRKYESLACLEKECDLLRSQVEKAARVEKDRDALVQQVEDLEKCICEQEDEIKRLVSHIDSLAKGREDHREKMKGIVSSLKVELNEKNSAVQQSEYKISTLQEEMNKKLQDLTKEVNILEQENTNLRCDKRSLEKQVNDLNNLNLGLEENLVFMQAEKEKLLDEIDGKDRAIDAMQEVLTDRESFSENDKKSKCSANCAKSRDRENTHLKEMLERSKGAIERISTELAKQTEQNKPKYKCCPNCTCKKRKQQVEPPPKIIIRCCPGCNCKRKKDKTSVSKVQQTDQCICKNKGLQKELAEEKTQQTEKCTCVSKTDAKEERPTSAGSAKGCCKCNCPHYRKKVEQKDEDEEEDQMFTARSTGEDTDIKHRVADVSVQNVPKSQLDDCLDHLKKAQQRIAELEEENENLRKLASGADGNELALQLENDLRSCRQRMAELEQALEDLRLENEALKKVAAGDTGQTLLLNELNNLKEQNALLQAELNRCKETVANLTQENEELKKWLASKSGDDILDLQNKLKECRDRMSELENENQALKKLPKSDADQLLNELNNLKEQNALLQAELNRCKETVANLTQENEELKKWLASKSGDDILDLQNKLKECRDRMSELEKENQALKKLPKSDADQLLVQMQSDLEKCLKEKEGLLKQIKELNDEIAKLRGEKGDFDKLLADNAVTTARRSTALENEIDKIKSQNAQLMDENSRLKARIQELEGMNKKLPALEDEIKRLLDENVKLKQEIENLKKIVVDPNLLDALRKENDNLRKQIEDQKGEISKLLDKLREPISSDKIDKAQLDKEMKEKEALQAIIDDLRRQMKAMGQVAEAPKPSGELERMLAELTKRLENAERRAEIAEEALKKLKSSDPSAMLNAELQKLRDRLAQIEQENAALKKALSDANNENASIKKELENALNENKKLADNYNKLQKSLDDLKQENSNLQKDLNKFREGAGDAALKSENDNLKSQIKKLEAQIEDLKSQLDQANRALKSYSDKISQIEAENTDLKKKEAQCQIEKAKIAKDLDNALADLQKLSDKNRDLEKDNAKLKQNIANLESEIAKLRKDLDGVLNDAKKGGTTIGELQKELAALKQRIAQLEAENARLEDENAVLKKELQHAKLAAEAANKLQEEINRLQKMVAGLEQAKKDLEGKYADANAKAANMTNLEDELARLRKQLKDKENENSDLKKQIAAASKDDRLDSLLAGNEKLKKAMADLENENSKVKSDLQRSLDELKRIKDDLNAAKQADAKNKERIAQLEGENAKLKNDLNAALDQLKKLNQEISGLQNENGKLKQNLSFLEEENNKLKKSLEDALTEKRKLNDELAALKDENTKRKQRIAQLESENAKLKSDLDSALNQLKKSLDENKAMQDENKKMKDKVSQLESENGKLRNTLDSVPKELKPTTDDRAVKITLLQDENNKLKAEIDALRNQLKALANLKDENDRLKAKITSLENENNNLKSSLGKAEEEVKKLSAELTKCKENETEMKKKMTQMENEKSRLERELGDYKARADKSEGDAARLRENEDKLKQKIAQLEAENARLKKELDAAFSDAKKLTDDLARLRNENKKLNEEIAKANAENIKLKKDLDNALGDLKKAENNLADLRKIEEKLKQRISQLESENGQIKKDLNNALDEMKKTSIELSKLRDAEAQAKQKLAQLESENSKLKKQADQTAGSSDNTNAELSQLRADNSKLKQKVASLEEELNKLRKELDKALNDVKNREQEISKQQDENARNKQKAADLEKKNQKLQQDLNDALSNLKSAKDENNKLKDENSKLKNLLSDLEAQIAKLKSELDAAKSKTKDGMSDIKDKERADKAEKENDKLKRDLEKALADAKKAADLQKDNVNLKKKLSDLESEIERLRKELEKAQHVARSSVIDVGKTKDNEANLKQQNAQLQAENVDLKNEVDQLRAQLAKLKKENAEMMANLKAQCDRELKKLMKDHEDAIARLQKAQQEAIKKLNEDHEREVKVLKDRINSLLAEIDRLKKLLDQSKFADSKERRESGSRISIEQIDQSETTEVKRISAEKEDTSKLLAEIARLKSLIKKLQEELDEANKEKDRLKKILGDQKRKSVDIKEKVEAVEKILEKERRKSKELEKFIKEQQPKEEVPTKEVPVKKEEIPVKKEDKLTMKTFDTVFIAPDVIPIIPPLSDSELKFFGKKPCPCAATIDDILKKALQKGIRSLPIEELQVLHNHISNSAATALEKLGKKCGVLRPNEGDKLSLMRRIAELEGDLIRKQNLAQQKLSEVQSTVKKEKDKLSQLRQRLEADSGRNPRHDSTPNLRTPEALQAIKNDLENKLREELLNKMRLEERLCQRQRGTSSNRETPVKDRPTRFSSRR